MTLRAAHLIGLLGTLFLAPLSSAHAEEPSSFAVAPLPQTMASPSAPMRRGFVAELQLNARTGAALGGLRTTTTGLAGGIFGGYKLDRFIFGAALSIHRSASSNSETGKGDTSLSSTLVEFMPGVRMTLLRSSDGAVELFGQTDLGFGRMFTGQSPEPQNPPDTNNFMLSYQLGPGLRYWPHPQLGVGVVGGMRGEFVWTTSTSGGSTTKTSVGTTGIFAGFHFLGVF